MQIACTLIMIVKVLSHLSMIIKSVLNNSNRGVEIFKQFHEIF